MHAPFCVEERAAAVARLNGDGQLNQFHAVEVALRRDDALHDAVFQPGGVPDGDNLRALLERGRITELERGQIARGDAHEGEIEFAIRGEHFRGVEAAAIRELDGDGPRLADDVQAGGNQAVGGDNEARAHAVLPAVASVMRDHDHGFAGAFGERHDVGRVVGAGGFFLRRNNGEGETGRQANSEEDFQLGDGTHVWGRM